MRVLIIDENVTTREMMSDLLSSAERKIHTAGTIKDAVELFNAHRPELVFLNTQLEGSGTGKLQKIISREDVRPRIIMIANNKAEMQAEVYVEGWLCKPFRSTDVTCLIDGTEARSEKKGRIKTFFTRVEMPSQTMKEHVKKDDLQLKFGRSYLFTEEEPIQLRNACRSFAERGDDILFITSGTVKGVKELMRNDSIKVIALSSKEGPNYVCGAKMGSVTAAMTSFIDSSKNPVIAVDDLQRLIDSNDLSSVLAMISQTVNNSCKRAVTLLVSMQPEGITDRDKGLLLRNMTEYEMK